MQAFQGYAESGKIIPLGNPVIPDGNKAIIAILDESLNQESRLERQKKALCAFEKGLAECKEPLPPEFDEIINRRVNFTRKPDI